ncbi:MAG: hypothetical protein ACREHD_00005, partial [Pirellulales bacterium]
MATAETGLVLDTLDLMILSRLLVKCAAAGARKDVGQLVATHLSPGEWTATFDARWNRLVQAGLIGFPPGKKPGKTFILTDAGRRRALDFLQVAELPAKATWSRVQSDYLLPLAMNLGPASREAATLKKSFPLNLSILVRAKDIKPRAGATAKNVLAAFAWKLVGVASEADFSAENVIQQLAFQRTPRKMTSQQVVAALAAAAVGSSKAGLADLRAAAIRQWLLPSPVKTNAAGDDDLEAFASRIIEAARQSPADARFGENKVFISHIWRQLNGNSLATALDLDGFKQRLVDANREGLLHLSRADLVEAMNPADVQES